MEKLGWGWPTPRRSIRCCFGIHAFGKTVGRLGFPGDFVYFLHPIGFLREKTYVLGDCYYYEVCYRCDLPAAKEERQSPASKTFIGRCSWTFNRAARSIGTGFEEITDRLRLRSWKKAGVTSSSSPGASSSSAGNPTS